MKKRIKLIIIVVILVCLGWFLVGSPILKFHKNEEIVENAARRYFELNSRQLPTGERIKTLSLKDIYHGKFLEKDIYAPFSKKTCSLEKSWVKVKRVDNEYKYYTYLDCGVLKSNIDAVGPKISLNGKEKITIGLGEEYKDEGVKSVIDDTDGNLNISDVIVKSNVDTSKIGTYEVSYIAVDSLSNKTTVVRSVEVVQKLYATIKKQLGEADNFTGEPSNNYVSVSNMLYRVYGVDKNKNVIIVADEDIANVNHNKIDNWLKYYYNHLNDKAKKMIVPNKYCNMRVDEANLATTECSSYTDDKNVYIPSIIEVNKAQGGEDNFMKTRSMSWVSNTKDDKEAYLTRKVFFYEAYGKSFLPYSNSDNYGVRPMMVIKGNSLIKDGNGSVSKPYIFDDVSKARGGSLANERFTGEYITISGALFRIVDVIDDGTVKVISNSSIGYEDDDMICSANENADKISYNPKDKSSVAYFINNKASEYLDTKYFTEHEIEVPVYKDKIVYGKEIKTNKYKVLLSAPNMYDMFSAMSYSAGNITSSYWLLNATSEGRFAGAVYDAGVPVNEAIDSYDKYGVRVVGYLKKATVIKSGKGTFNNPYELS